MFKFGKEIFGNLVVILLLGLLGLLISVKESLFGDGGLVEVVRLVIISDEIVVFCE